MNILCVSKYAALPSYGAGARLFYLAKEFKKRGHETLLITSDSNHLANFPDTSERFNNETIDGLDVIWIKTKKYKRTASIDRVLSWIDFEFGLFSLNRDKLPKPDVVLISSLSIFSIVYGCFLKKKFKAKLIFEIRDIWPLTMIEEGGFSRWHPLVLLIGFLEKIGYKYSDLIVGTMPRLDKHVKSILGYEKPFLCSPLGFDEEMNTAREQTVLNSLDDVFPNDKIIIGYAGSMGLTNNLAPFIECVKSLSKEPNIHFVLVGGGDLKEQYLGEVGQQHNVTFVPKIPPSSIPTFLQKCDILYLSTHDSKVWDYGQSMNKVVEYMLSAKPVVASYSGYQSMLNEANSGVFVPSNDVALLKKALLVYVELDEIERKDIGLRGREWIKKYRSYSVLSDVYLDVLDEVCDG